MLTNTKYNDSIVFSEQNKVSLSCVKVWNLWCNPQNPSHMSPKMTTLFQRSCICSLVLEVRHHSCWAWNMKWHKSQEQFLERSQWTYRPFLEVLLCIPALNSSWQKVSFMLLEWKTPTTTLVYIFLHISWPPVTSMFWLRRHTTGWIMWSLSCGFWQEIIIYAASLHHSRVIE